MSESRIINGKEAAEYYSLLNPYKNDVRIINGQTKIGFFKNPTDTRIINGHDKALYDLVASGTVTAANTQLSLVDGTAFAYFSGVDLSAYQTGKHLLAVYNSTTGLLIAQGYCSATPPAGESVGADIGNDFTNWTGAVPTGWSQSGTPSANGYTEEAPAGNFHIVSSVTFPFIGIVKNQLTVGTLYRNTIDISACTGSISVGGDTAFHYSTFSTTGNDQVKYFTATTVYAQLARIYGNTDVTLDNWQLEPVTDPASTGLRIEATPGGSQNWTTKGAGAVNAAVNYKIWSLGN